MILLTVSDGTHTEYLTSIKSKLVGIKKGYKKDGIFYKPKLLSYSDFKKSADNIERISDTSITIDAKIARLFTGRDLSVIASIWNEKSGTRSRQYEVFNGRGFLKKENKDIFIYQLKTDKDELANELLVRAPDIKQVKPSSDAVYFTDGHIENTYLEERYFPMTLGLLKYIAMFALTIDSGGGTGEYLSDGTVHALYDGGQSLNYAQHVDNRVMQNNAKTAPIYGLTMDIDGSTDTALSSTASTSPLPLNFSFTQDSEPLATEWTLLNGMRWIDTADLNKEYVWDTTIADGEYGHSYWKRVTDTRVDTAITDAGKLQTIVSGVNLPTTGMIAGLNITQNFMGYYNDLSMTWDSYIASNGQFYFGGDADNYMGWDGSTLNMSGTIKSSDFVDIPTGEGFRLKSNAVGTSADPTIFGGHIKGSIIEANNMFIATGGTKQARLSYMVNAEAKNVPVGGSLVFSSRSNYLDDGLGGWIADFNLVYGSQYSNPIIARQYNYDVSTIDYPLTNDLILNRANVICDIEVIGSTMLSFGTTAGQVAQIDIDVSIDGGATWFGLGAGAGKVISYSYRTVANSRGATNGSFHFFLNRIAIGSLSSLRFKAISSNANHTADVNLILKVTNY